jgi:hypothetical protein
MNGNIEAQRLPISSHEQDVPNRPETRKCSYEKGIDFVKPKVASRCDADCGRQQQN